MLERQLQVGKVSVRVREWGDEGMPVVFWHALGDHSSMQMAEVGPILAKDHGLHVVGVDAPGFGGSAPALADAQYEIPALTSFIARLVEALELDRPAWLGSSWGASVGIAFAGTHAETIRALALLDGGYWNYRDEPLLTHSLNALREQERASPDYRWANWEAAFAEYRALAGRWSPDLERYVRSVIRTHGQEVVSVVGPDTYAAALYGLLHADLPGMHQRLAATDIPVLLLVATEDSETRAKRERLIREFRSHLPMAEVRRIRAPHLMLEAQPREVANIVGPWLSRFA